jgi:hypothetical protein
MSTVQDIINGALNKLGILRKGETPDSTDSADALNVLNDILGSWSNESLLLYATVTDTLSLSPASSYSIGTGQTLNTERPMWIKAATIASGGLDYPLQIIPEDDFQTRILQKTISTNIPQYLTYNNAFPYGTIKLWPQLSVATTITLQSEKQITAFPSLTTTFSMPPGWSLALKSNLAVALSSEYNTDQDIQSTMAEAAMSKGNLKRQAIKAHPMTYSGDVVTRYSIYTGTE